MMEETAGTDAPDVPEEAAVAIESAEVEPVIPEETVEATESPVEIIETTEVVLEVDSETSESTEVPPVAETEIAAGPEVVAEVAAEQPAEEAEIVDPMESHAETPATPSKLFVIPHALPHVIRYVPSYYMAQRPLGSGYFYIY
jgi:hypothetical protein